MRRVASSWVVGIIWGINLLGLLAILGMIVLRLSAYPGEAKSASRPLIDSGPRLLFALPPTPLFSPTVTLFVPATPTPTPTPFSFELAQERREVIGYSYAGRPIEVYTFGNGHRQRMIVAGIHGGYEGNTIDLAEALIAWLDANPEFIPHDKTLYILRSLNPDGEARGRNEYGRSNARGVDLNRNFPVNWRAVWDRRGCWNVLKLSGGAYPGSEPETQAMMNFIQTHSIEALISYHSAALGIFPGGEPWDRASIRLAQALSEVTGYPFPPIQTGCVYTGTLADYAASLGIAAVDMELSNHHDIEFEKNLEALRILLEWEEP